MSAFSILLAEYDGDPTCNLHWIGRMLGHNGSCASLEKYVTNLIEQEGFPAPLPHRKHGGGLSRGVSYRRSQWIRAGVLEWLGDQLPPPAAGALDANHRQAAADEMDRRAGHLQLVSGNG